MYTVNCIRCLKKKARLWGGHVLRGKKWIIAGWCGERCLNSKGFNGQYTKAMGSMSRVK